MIETINQILDQILPFLGICFAILFVYMIIKPLQDYYNEK